MPDMPWIRWEHDPDVHYQKDADGDIRIEVTGLEGGPRVSGFMRPMGGMLDATIRQHLREMGLIK